MKSRRTKKRTADLDQAMWVKLPRTGKVLKKLDKNGVVHVKGKDPEFAGAPYYVHLGLRVHERGPIRYGTLDSLKAGDYFYAEVRNSGSFDIHLKAQNFSDRKVTIQWWAIPQGSTVLVGPTVGPTPTLPPVGLTTRRFRSRDFPGRYVNEVPGIGSKFIRRLTRARMKSLAALASADAGRVAHILGISEVRAMSFIYQARLLLLGKTRK
jgi:hypothetical protein